MSIIISPHIDSRLTQAMMATCDRVGHILDACGAPASDSLLTRLIDTLESGVPLFQNQQDELGLRDVVHVFMLAKYCKEDLAASQRDKLDVIREEINWSDSFSNYCNDLLLRDLNENLLKIPFRGSGSAERCGFIANALDVAINEIYAFDQGDSFYMNCILQVQTEQSFRMLRPDLNPVAMRGWFASKHLELILQPDFLDVADTEQVEVFSRLISEYAEIGQDVDAGLESKSVAEFAISLGRVFLGNFYAGGLLCAQEVSLDLLTKLDEKARRFARNLLGDIELGSRGSAWRQVVDSARRESLIFYGDIYRACYPQDRITDIPTMTCMGAIAKAFEVSTHGEIVQSIFDRKIDVCALIGSHDSRDMYIDMFERVPVFLGKKEFSMAYAVAKLQTPEVFDFGIQESIELALETIIEKPTGFHTQMTFLSRIAFHGELDGNARKIAEALVKVSELVPKNHQHSFTKFIPKSMLDTSVELSRIIAPKILEMKNMRFFIDHFGLDEKYFRSSGVRLTNDLKRALLGNDFGL